MIEGPEWFAPKRHGFGAGWPIAWQGWALLAGYIALSIAASLLLEEKPAALAVALVVTTALLIWIAWKTTRGGWRWRWGRKD